MFPSLLFQAKFVPFCCSDSGFFVLSQTTFVPVRKTKFVPVFLQTTSVPVCRTTFVPVYFQTTFFPVRCSRQCLRQHLFLSVVSDIICSRLLSQTSFAPVRRFRHHLFMSVVSNIVPVCRLRRHRLFLSVVSNIVPVCRFRHH